MKNTVLRLFSAVMAFVLLACASFAFSPVSADIADGFAGGNGTESEPYLISSAAELAYLGSNAALAECGGKYYKLTGDIDLGGGDWTAIGDDDAAFSGVFDGDHHTISGLQCISTTDYAGLFGKTDGATVKNLNIVGSELKAKYAGPVAGYCLKTTVVNCHTVVGSIEGTTIGGIVGRIQTSPCVIESCTSASSLILNTESADHYVGGIAGLAGGTTVSHCASFGNTSAPSSEKVSTKNYWAGGVVGGLGLSGETSTVEYSYSVGSISGNKSMTTGTVFCAGGIAGRISVVDSAIKTSYSSSEINWDGDKGGVIGQVYKKPVLIDVFTTNEAFIGRKSVEPDLTAVYLKTVGEMKNEPKLTAIFDKYENVFTDISVSLGESISVNCYLSLSALTIGSELRFTMNGKTATVPALFDADSGTYKYRFDGIAPQCTGDEITAKIVKSDSSVYKEKTFSVKEYLQALKTMTAAELSYSTEKYNNMITLINDLLVYGSAAQVYRNYKTDSLLDESVTGSAFTALSETDCAVTDCAGRITFTSVSLYFSGINKLRFRFDATDLNGLTFGLKRNGGAETEVNCTDNGNGTYSILTDAIKATGYNDIYTLTVYSGGASIASASYSVKSYVYSMQNKTDGGVPTTMAMLARAAYCYGLSAIEFGK